jgi:tetratricopeptide (TPR) repeat protein
MPIPTPFRLLNVMILSVTVALGGFCVPTDVPAAGEFEQGLKAARGGDLARAIQMWTAVIKRNPKSYAAHVNRGSACLRSGYVFQGIADWHKARDLSPVFAYSVYTGDLLVQASGNTAMLNYAAPLELEPEYVASIIMIGALYMDLGRTAMAAELFRKSMDLTKNPLLKTHLNYWANEIEGKQQE